MRAEFENELKQLHKELLIMGSVLEKTMDIMLEAIEKRDITALEKVIDRDDIIDDYEYSIEKKCLSMILRQQPVAADLRTIASILKIITDLERIADQCSDVAKYEIKILKNQSKPSGFDNSSIIKMAEQVKKMVTSTIDCYVNLDAKKAVKVSMEDDIVDNYFSEITKQIQEEMIKNKEFVNEGICLLYIIKYIERMGDHTTNVCEWIAYRVTGEHKQYN